MHLDGGPVGGVVLRPGRQAGPAHAVQVHLPLLLRRRQFDSAYTTMWPQVTTNKKVGVMWPNDSDGNAIRQELGPLLAKAGYTIVDPGAYTDGTNDYSAQIAKFKSEDCEIFNTFPIPPDFATFWQQAAQQGYKPKIAQIAKTGLFPSQVEALGAIGIGLASAAYWTPTFPYTSSLTGVSSADLASGYEGSSGKQWNQQLGPSLALFDAAAAASKASGRPQGQSRPVPRRSGRCGCGHPVGQPGVGARARIANVVRDPRSSAASGSRRPPANHKLAVRDLRELLRPQGARRRQAAALRGVSEPHRWTPSPAGRGWPGWP